MGRPVFVFCLYLISAGSAVGQLGKGQVDMSKVPVPGHHYVPEYTFDAPTNPEAWKQEKAGLNVSFATTDELYLRSEVPPLEKKTLSWEDTGWRGERLHAQVLVWSPDLVGQVRFHVNDLKTSQGKVFSRENVTVNMVRYVLSNFPYGARALNCGSGVTDSVYLMPDRFESFDRFDLPAGSVRPVWVSFDIPADTEPGTYTGTIHVRSEKEQSVLNVRINVQQQQLPQPHDWEFRLDLWQNPWVVAQYYNLEPWSDEHRAMLKEHLKLYADAGGKYITTYAVHSPWSDNSYTIEGTMIDWLKRTDGSWKFDYSIFDQYVDLCMETGIDEAITIYTPVPWGYRFRYLDESTGNYEYEEWSPESEEFRTNFTIFLSDLKAHLEKKGWFDKTYLGINENPLNITVAAAKVIKEHSEDWRITYAGDWHAELTGLLDDYSPVIGKEPTREELLDRKLTGSTTTYYVCCTPPQPNNFVFSPPVEGTYISWYAAAYGYDGFLRWAYDAWPADPMRDARHTLWPAGDCFLVYPGGTSSIRFEKLREGIADFEKIRILRALAEKSSDSRVRDSMKAFEKHLATMTGESGRGYDASLIAGAVAKGKQMLDAISSQLTR